MFNRQYSSTRNKYRNTTTYKYIPYNHPRLPDAPPCRHLHICRYTHINRNIQTHIIYSDMPTIGIQIEKYTNKTRHLPYTQIYYIKTHRYTSTH